MLFKIAYLPPLLIYASAGVSGLTSIVGIFFIKDYLKLSIGKKRHLKIELS